VRPPDPLLRALHAAGNVLIATHSPMDGDGLGCGLALQRALNGAGKRCRFVTEAALPRAYAFLDGYDGIERLAPGPLPPFDLLLGLDAGDSRRLGRPHAERPRGSVVCNIDHHVSNERYGDVAWVVPEAAATGELAFALIRALGLPVDPAIALALLVSLVTDTGRFCYSSTGPGTFETGAELLRLGADPDLIHRHLYASVPLGVLRLHARATEEIRLPEGGRAALLVVPWGYGADLGAEEEDVKDLVDLVISIRGVVVAALVRGLPSGGSKVSLRSKSDRADVAALAGRCGGGGHVRAAGYTSPLGEEAAAAALLPALGQLAVAASG